MWIISYGYKLWNNLNGRVVSTGVVDEIVVTPDHPIVWLADMNSAYSAWNKYRTGAGTCVERIYSAVHVPEDVANKLTPEQRRQVL